MNTAITAIGTQDIAFVRGGFLWQKKARTVVVGEQAHAALTREATAHRNARLVILEEKPVADAPTPPDVNGVHADPNAVKIYAAPPTGALAGRLKEAEARAEKAEAHAAATSDRLDRMQATIDALLEQKTAPAPGKAADGSKSEGKGAGK